MSLPEDLRQEYLEALGIDSYFPRVRLPGAPEPVPCAWSSPREDNAGGSRETAPPVLKQVAAPPRETSPAAGEAATPPPAPAAANEPPAPGATVKPVPEDVRLQLLCIRVDESLVVLNAMPHMGPRQLGSRHLALLQNLLRAGGIDQQQVQVDDKPFHWPMVQGGHVDNGRAAAAAALSAFLQQKHAHWQFSRLLVLGEFTLKQVFTGDGGGDAPALADHPWQWLYARSLDEYLQQPALKKELWPVLRRCRA